MTAMLIRLQVTDFTAWLPEFFSERAIRRAHGAQQERIFRNAIDPHEVLVLMEWDDVERARLYAEADDVRVAAWQAVVSDPPEIWLLQDITAQQVEANETQEGRAP